VQKVSLASNATAADGPTLLRIVPHWLRVFGEQLAEIVVVVDSQPLAGRIGQLQTGHADPEKLNEARRLLESLDARVRFVALESIDPLPIQKRWFGRVRPVRCQGGTPILAFVAAIEQAKCDFVLRCDSDMLFCETGWLQQQAVPALRDGVDFYEPPRSCLVRQDVQVSSRAFMVSMNRLSRRLPLRNLRLDPLRVVHRLATGRPPWLALEQMITQSVRKMQLSHRVGIDSTLGFSLHGLKRAWTAAPWFEEVIRSVEAGRLPAPQQASWDFHPEYWGVSAGC
jgi:hypothetical protein